jgi:DNA-directed RNA polymerase specialized sigma24 family protein
MDLSLNGLPTGAARTARPAPGTLTPSRLGEAWPEVSARLDRMLASRGVDPVLREDIVQEVALRALDKQVPFTDPADLYRWAATTARNLHVDILRTGGRTTGDDALVAVADPSDVAHTAERRVALGQVWRALALMRPNEQEAILDSLDEDRHARSSQVLVRRHRARATLRRAVGGVLSTLGAVRLRLRSAGVAAPGVTSVAAIALLGPVLVLDLARPTVQRPNVSRAPAVTVLTGDARPVTAASRTAIRSDAARPRAAAGSGALRRATAPAAAPAPKVAEVRAPGGIGGGIDRPANPEHRREVCVGVQHPDAQVCAPRPDTGPLPDWPPTP